MTAQRVDEKERGRTDEVCDPARLSALARFWIPALIVVLVIAAFSASFGAQFVNLDDDLNFVFNHGFRGFDAQHLAWMFTTTHMGQFQPGTWISFGVDHALWGLSAAHFHATNVGLHALNALAVYFLALELLRRVSKARFDGRGAVAGAAFAAGLFALHPLRAESVAWISGRADLTAGLFFALGILAWLRYARCVPAPEIESTLGQGVAGLGVMGAVSFLTSTDLSSPDALQFSGLGAVGVGLGLVAIGLSSLLWLSATKPAGGRTAFGLAVFCTLLSLASHPLAFTLPAVLLVLDVWPLRRWVREEQGREARTWTLIVEKTPLVALSVCFAALAHWAKGAPEGALRTLAEHSIPERLLQSFHGLGFYPLKSLAPVGLLPVYDMPMRLSFGDPRFLVPLVLVVGITPALFIARRRVPALLAAWVVFAILIAPVPLLFQDSARLVADRYSYLAGLPFALLAGGGLALLIARAPRQRNAWLGGALLIVGTLAILTWRQARHWRDTESLYAHGIEVGRSPWLVTNLAMIYNRRAHEQPRQRDEILERALELSTQGIALAEERGMLAPVFRLNHGMILNNIGRPEEALAELEIYVAEVPQDAEGRLNLGLTLNKLGRFKQAVGHLERAALSVPSNTTTWRNLGLALEGANDPDAAREAYQRAWQLEPGNEFVKAKLFSLGPE